MSQIERTDLSLRTVLDIYLDRHPRGFRALAELCRPDFWFRDPFVEIHGFKQFMTFLREADTLRQDRKWVVSGHAAAEWAGYVRWHFFADYKDGTSFSCDGMSEFGFDDQGLLASQIDFWDSAEALVARKPKLREGIIRAKKSIVV